MIVLKFGGTSVSTPESIVTMCDIVTREIKRDPILVVSAVSTVTDTLLALENCLKQERPHYIKTIQEIHRKLARQLLSQKDQTDLQKYILGCISEIKKILSRDLPSAARKDRIVSYGEIISSYLVSQVLQIHDIKAEQIIATTLITTDNQFGKAEFLPVVTKKNVQKSLIPLIKKKKIPVVTGFIGSTKEGVTTTLGRGGSDYTASIIAFALNAEEIQIWTDVDGVYTADPRIVKNAKLLKTISYQEASEMAMFGAKVLHPRTLRPAISKGIPVKVLNTFSPDKSGTLIKKTNQLDSHITVVTSKKKIPLINIYSTDMLHSKGFLIRIFDCFAKQHISIDLVSVSEVSVSITLDNDDNLPEVLQKLSQFTSVTKMDDYGIVALIGDNIIGVSHILHDIFALLEKNNITVKMISYGATDINVSLVIPSKTINIAVQLLHDEVLLQKSQGDFL